MKTKEEMATHELLKFWEGRSRAYQNALEMVLPLQISGTLALLKLKEVINTIDQQVGVDNDPSVAGGIEAILKQLRAAYPQHAQLSDEDLIKHFNKQAGSATYGSRDQQR